MRKIIVLLVCLVLASTFASAYTNRFVKKTTGTVSLEVKNNNIICCKSYGYGDMMAPVDIEYKWKQRDNCKVPEQWVGGNKEVVEDGFCSGPKAEQKLTGIENAITRVRNNETAEHLRQVLARIQEKRLEQINKLENLKMNETDDGDVEIEGEKDAKFLGIFKAKHSYKFEVSEETGELVRVKKPFDFLWKDDAEIQEVIK